MYSATLYTLNEEDGSHKCCGQEKAAVWHRAKRGHARQEPSMPPVRHPIPRPTWTWTGTRIARTRAWRTRRYPFSARRLIRLGDGALEPL